MQLSTIAPRQAPVAASSAAAADDRNPWGFPRLDARIAQQALDGLEAGARIVNRLIDRSIGVRTMLDRDLKRGVFSTDTVRAVSLLTRARDYALGTLDQRHLSNAIQIPVIDWIRANQDDDRIRAVGHDMFRLERAVTDLLDDDEGNVREEIAAMRTDPSRRVWQSIRDGVDGSIATLYEARDIGSSQHILRAAGGLR